MRQYLDVKEQHRDALVWGLAFVQRQPLLERAGDDSDPVAGLEPRRLGKLDKPVALAGMKLGNDGVRDARRPLAVHDQAGHARAPARAMPLQDEPGNNGGRTSMRRPRLIRRSRSRGR